MKLTFPSIKDLVVWYRSMPIITRYWLTATVVIPLVAQICFLNPWWMILEYSLFVKKFQIWRPVTALFYWPIQPSVLGFLHLNHLYLLYFYSKHLETGFFGGRPADYFLMLIFNWLCATLIALFVNVYVLMDLMANSIVYVWCQVNADQIVIYWKARNFPWILVAATFTAQWLIRLTVRQQSTNGLIGVIGTFIGYLYYFLAFKYPQEYGGRSFIQTPQFLYYWFPCTRWSGQSFGRAPTNRRAPDNNYRTIKICIDRQGKMVVLKSSIKPNGLRPKTENPAILERNIVEIVEIENMMMSDDDDATSADDNDTTTGDVATPNTNTSTILNTTNSQ